MKRHYDDPGGASEAEIIETLQAISLVSGRLARNMKELLTKEKRPNGKRKRKAHLRRDRKADRSPEDDS